MNRRLTFSQKLALGFALVVSLAGLVVALAISSIREVVARTDAVVNIAAQRLVDTERLHALSFKGAADSRAYLMTRNPRILEELRDTRGEFRRTLDLLAREVQTDEGRQLLAAVDRADEAYQRILLDVLATSASTSVEAAGARAERDVRPAREVLDRAIDAFLAREGRLLAEDRHASAESAQSAIRKLLLLALAAVLLATGLAFGLARSLARQITRAIRHVESSSSELQAAAGEQATGAKEQATAMAEITTTISELLATSRQISESAQRVAGIAGETAGAAKAGDQTVQRSQDSVGSIRRQVELIVGHMLELGRKSQQIGGVLEIINELAEQTNILAINATIEAAGAGEAGKRFAVVAEEIRKLADRVAGSTKDIRVLIDEVRSAVNTTVMATESGSKAVEAGARQFTEVAAAFTLITRLVGTTREAAREIELSTKQQATAVEQVNGAVANVAQATREAEASSGEALRTASQLAQMSRDLSSLVEPARAG